jgi:3-dehydroquinate dehydratase-2
MTKILILNGPNLNLLGKREPEIYGTTDFEHYIDYLRRWVKNTNHVDNVELDYYQSNVEGLLIDKLHEVGFDYAGIIFNPGAYAHTSVALADAVRAIQTPVVEVHISNVHARESFRHHSYLSAYCEGVISGFGLNSYKLAVRHFINLLA